MNELTEDDVSKWNYSYTASTINEKNKIILEQATEIEELRVVVKKQYDMIVELAGPVPPYGEQCP